MTQPVWIVGEESPDRTKGVNDRFKSTEPVRSAARLIFRGKSGQIIAVREESSWR
jgi:hypothetical protein